MKTKPNVKQAVPFLGVSNIEASVHYYVDGLGFKLTKNWIDEGKLRSICFICEDALAFYREVTARGVQASEPFVGNGMWVASLSDPDGYRIEFESYTDAPEDTRLSEIEGD